MKSLPLPIRARTSFRSHPVTKSVIDAMPIVLCYLPVGFAVGIVAVQTRFSLLETFLFSLLVYSGSGQSIALGLLASGEPLFAICTTALVVNLRYSLMTAALAPFLSGWPARLKYAFAAGITDETFALHAGSFRKGLPPRAYLFGVNATAHAAWVTGTVLGHVAGARVGDVRPLGLDFAVPAMFIALVVLQIENRLMTALALLGAAMAVTLRFTALSSWAVILSGIACATLGAIVETRALAGRRRAA